MMKKEQLIRRPVRFSELYEIVDARGQIIIPAITWAADYAHLARQKEIGELVAQLINTNGIEVPEESEARAVKNPWGRNGKPK